MALLVSGIVLVDDTVSGSLIEFLYGCGISLGSLRLVTRNDGSLKLLYGSLQLRTEHLVAKSLCFDDLYALFRGFDIRQNFHLPRKILCLYHARHLRGCAGRPSIQLSIIPHFFPNCKRKTKFFPLYSAFFLRKFQKNRIINNFFKNLLDKAPFVC